MYRFFAIFVLSMSLLLTSCSTVSQGQLRNDANGVGSSVERNVSPGEETFGALAVMTSVVAILVWGAI